MGGSGVAASPPVPADIGVVAALPIEIGPLLRKFREVRRYSNERQTIAEGELAGKLVVLLVAGPGRKAAAKGARLLLAGHRPRWMISAGFGGALDPTLKRNDVLFATDVVDAGGSRWQIDVGLPHEAARRRIVSGRLLTVDRIVRTAAEKAELRTVHAADAVDMETSAVAAVCAERGVRFLSLRVVTDEAGADLPPEIMTILGRSGGYRVGATLGAVWKRPASVRDLWALREHAVAAAKRLAAVVTGVIAQLP
jgi:adenosylhomocysteine nucleosidase